MSETKHNNWSSWLELSESERRMAVHDEGFWPSLSPEQQQRFLAEADWQEIRLNPEAKQAYLDGLIPLEELCQRLELDDVELAFLMSTRQMPAALVDGAWKFDWLKVQGWVEGMGGLEAVHQDVEQQIREHQEAQKR